MRRPLFALAALVLGLLLALVAGEILLRGIGYRFTLHPETVQFGWPDPVELKNRYVVDRDLLWVPRDYAARIDSLAENGVDLVVAGDSCTEFGGYHNQVAQRLRDRFPESSLGVAQVGVGGWSSYQGLRQLERDLLPLRPRAISFYFGWNDHWNSFGIEDADIGRFHQYQDPESGARQLRLVQLLDAFRFRRFEDSESERPPRVSEEDFRANLTAMVRLCSEEGIVPLLITAPSNLGRGGDAQRLRGRWIGDPQEADPLHRRYAEIVREVARLEDAALVDLLAHFDEIRDERQRGQLFQRDGIHLTWPGNLRVGDKIFASVDSLGVFEAAGP